jgi:hypothetical protein
MNYFHKAVYVCWRLALLLGFFHETYEMYHAAIGSQLLHNTAWKAKPQLAMFGFSWPHGSLRRK